MESRGDRTQREILGQPEAWVSTFGVTDDHMACLARVDAEGASAGVASGCDPTYDASPFAVHRKGHACPRALTAGRTNSFQNLGVSVLTPAPAASCRPTSGSF